MKLIELYKELLACGSLSVDAEGLVSATVGKSSTPFSVEGKRLVLPTQQQLSTPGWDNRVVFHPLSENILRGESKVMERFRAVINMRMNYVLGALAPELLQVSGDVESHKHMTPDQTPLLTKLLGADEKVLKTFQSIQKAMAIDSKERCFVHIFLKRGGVVQGKKYNRAAIVTFPLYEALKDEEAKQVFGVTLSKKHKQIIRSLIEFIFPGVENPSAFDAGSESDIAPFLDCLMRAVMKLAGCINTVICDYTGFITHADELIYNDDWVETFDNLATLLPEIRMIPMQAGNEGSTPKTAVQQTQTQQLQNVTTATPVVHSPTGTVPMPTAQAMTNAWNPHQPLAAATPGQPTIVRTPDGKIDMAATNARNPQLQAQFNGGGYGGFPGMQPPPPPGPLGNRMGQPRWSQPQMVMGGQQWGQQPQAFGMTGVTPTGRL